MAYKFSRELFVFLKIENYVIIFFLSKWRIFFLFTLSSFVILSLLLFLLRMSKCFLCIMYGGINLDLSIISISFLFLLLIANKKNGLLRGCWKKKVKKIIFGDIWKKKKKRGKSIFKRNGAFVCFFFLNSYKVFQNLITIWILMVFLR